MAPYRFYVKQERKCFPNGEFLYLKNGAKQMLKKNYNMGRFYPVILGLLNWIFGSVSSFHLETLWGGVWRII